MSALRETLCMREVARWMLSQAESIGHRVVDRLICATWSAHLECRTRMSGSRCGKYAHDALSAGERLLNHSASSDAASTSAVPAHHRRYPTEIPRVATGTISMALAQG